LTGCRVSNGEPPIYIALLRDGMPIFAASPLFYWTVRGLNSVARRAVV
jgi:hypothetical protein